VYLGVSLEKVAATSAETAYDRAFEAHWNDVFRFALAWTNDWGAAEDVAQETFVRLWRHRGSLDWTRDIRPWLLVTARRVAIDRFRGLRRRLFGSSPPASLTPEIVDRWDDARRAMADLSPLERTSLILTHVEGHDPTEAAVLLGITPGAVRAATSRARAKLVVAR
jgi:RNA polymerase sigma-70 factor (ECF subfamily)